MLCTTHTKACQILRYTFVTGFSSVIPGFPRYSVIGDSKNGVFNLRVVNASLEDDAEFQCQVGPANFHKAIRADARLSVICEYTYSILFICRLSPHLNECIPPTKYGIYVPLK